MTKNRLLSIFAAFICSSCSEESARHWFTLPDDATGASTIQQSDLELETVYYQVEAKKSGKESFEYVQSALVADTYEVCKNRQDGWHFYATTEGGGEEIKGDRLLAYFLKRDMSFSVSLSVLEVCDQASCKQHLSISRKKIRLTSDDDKSSLRRFCDTGDW